MSRTPRSSEPVFGLSPPHDGSEFELEQLFPDLFSTSSSDAELAEVDANLTDSLKANNNNNNGKGVIHMKMNSEQADELMRYLSGEEQQHKGAVTVRRPCFEHVRDTDTKSAINSIATSITTVSPSMISRNDSPSSPSYDNPQGLSRNAIAARENRLKKKMYLEGLEGSVQTLTGENGRLKKEVNAMRKTVGSLTTEVKYLKSVLANQSTLSSLLKNIQNTQGLKFMSSFDYDSQQGDQANSEETVSRKRALPNEKSAGYELPHQMCTRGKKVQRLNTTFTDHCYQKPGKSTEDSNPSTGLSNLQPEDGAGVCLHVSSNSVSLEFCAGCNNNAKHAAALHNSDDED